MQIVEGSIWAVRTARLTLKGPCSNLRIALFPMVHLGEPEFYQTVYSDAFSHDIVLVEGVNSPTVRSVMEVYRKVASTKAINLVVQPPYPSQASCRAKIVRADLSEEEFARVWRNIPMWVRATIRIALPILGAWPRWFDSRDTLALSLPLDDLPRRDETLSLTPLSVVLNHAIMHERDARLIARLREQLDDPNSTIGRIAIVYGAQHMRAVLRELVDRRDYQVERADWLTVFLV